MSPKELEALPNLDDDDFKVFGSLIQHFCFVDLNLRSALEVFAISKMLPKSAQKLYPDLANSKLIEVLIQIVKGMDAAVEDVPKALNFLEGDLESAQLPESGGAFRGQAFPNKDVYVFASKSDKDARNVLGGSLRTHHVHIAVAGRSEFLEMTKSVGLAQLWLSEKIPEWDHRYLGSTRAA